MFLLFQLIFGIFAMQFKTLSTNISKNKDMAEYIKQEVPDMRNEGETKAYYRMKTIRNIGMEEFVEIMTRHGGLSRGTAIAALMQASDTLGELMGMGYTVTLDGFGTFKATVGMKRFKEMDTIDGDEAKRNAQSLCVDGVNFKADKELIRQVDRHCKLERSHTSRLRKSPYTREERLARALQFIEGNGFMHLKDYVQMTGLSRSTACRELQELCRDHTSGIDTSGRGAHKVFVKRITD